MESDSLDATDLRLLDLLQNDASRHNQTLASLAHVSPPTSLRRIKRLRELGVIEREVALLHPDRLAPLIGSGLTALVEVSLERQSAEHMDSFEAHVLPDPAVQQCYRVSPGPDFMLVVHTTDMPAYLALAQRLFTASANVRNVKAFFSVKRAKFDPRLPLTGPGGPPSDGLVTKS
jgi:Lrp/AsnC family transcriptional regulator, leucine-responsive regulatory protein